MNKLNETALDILKLLTLSPPKTVKDLEADLYPDGPPIKHRQRLTESAVYWRIRAGIKKLLKLGWSIEAGSHTTWALNCYHYKLVLAMSRSGQVKDAVEQMDRCPSTGEVMAFVSEYYEEPEDSDGPLK